MNDFGDMTPRIKSFRDELLKIEPKVCAERARLATKAYREHESDQIILKRAYMLKEVLENMSIYIEPQTLIVGNQASENRAAPVFPEYAMDWVVQELDEFEKREGDRFTISEENKQTLREIYPYWKGCTLQDKGYAAYPESARTIYDIGIIRNEGNITSGDAHLAVDYASVLKYGLEGIRSRVREKLDRLDYTDYNCLKTSYFYRAILIAVGAVENFAHRYSKLAEEEARSAPPRAQKSCCALPKSACACPCAARGIFTRRCKASGSSISFCRSNPTDTRSHSGASTNFYIPITKRARKRACRKKRRSNFWKTCG